MDNVNENNKLNFLSSVDISNLSPEDFEMVKYQAYNLIDNQDYDNAVAYAEILESKLGQNKAQTRELATMYNVLSYWVYRLKVFAFSSLPAGEGLGMLKNNILDILRYQLDIRKAVYRFLSFFETDSIILDYSKSLLLNISSNQQILGSKSDAFSRSNFKPTVANWLEEYQSILHLPQAGSQVEPGTFHILKFLDTNPKIKNLTTAEKEILKALLDFYNWLLSPIGYSNKVRNDNGAQNYIVREKYDLPEGLTSSPIVRSNLATPKPLGDAQTNEPTGGDLQSPLIPAVKRNIGLMPDDSMTLNRTRPTLGIKNFPSQSNNRSSEVSKTTSSSGPEWNKNKQQEIDKKLQDLEKRISKQK